MITALEAQNHTDQILEERTTGVLAQIVRNIDAAILRGEYKTRVTFKNTNEAEIAMRTLKKYGYTISPISEDYKEYDIGWARVAVSLE